MNRSDLPYLNLTGAVAKSRKWIDLDHYSVAPYASTERHTQTLVVVDPTVTEPTLLLRARAREARWSNVYAVLVPTLGDLTLALAQQITGVVATHFGLRRFGREQRQANDLSPHLMTPVSHTFA